MVMDALRGGAQLNQRITYCWPKMMDACLKNNYEELSTLIANGEDVFIKSIFFL